MSRIAFLGNFSVDFSSETHHKKSLEALGHEVIALQETQASSEEILSEALQSDMFVWVHTHGWQTPGIKKMNVVLFELKRRRIPTVTYHLDLWLGLSRQRDLNTDPVYKDIQHFFTVDPDMANWFNKNTMVTGHYLPPGVYHEETVMAEPSIKPNYKHDVIFVGSKRYHPEWPYRPRLITWLQANYKNRFAHFGGDSMNGVVRGERLNQLYADTKVVVGDSLVPNFTKAGYWSDRIYETIGRGGFIIHPYVKGLENEFEDRKHVVFYNFNDFGGLKHLIDYYLVHDEERERIRKQGFEHVKNHYTYMHRWQYIIDTVLGK